MSDSNKIPLTRRGRENRVLGRRGKPLLVVIEGKNIDAMIDAGLRAIGGLEHIIGDHREVLLKPNTNQRDPFPSITAPETLRAVASHCRKAGVDHIIVHEDHKFELDLYYKPAQLPGIDIQISSSADVNQYVLVEYEKWHGDMNVETALQNIELRPPESLLKSEFERTEGPRIRVAHQLQKAPVIINMPVVKRHFAGQMTSALKNHFGSVYGPHRWLAHASLQKDRDYYDRKLAEFASAIRPELTITDVRSMQARSGPFRDGSTRIIEGINRVIITGDMIAADVVALDLVKRYDDTFTQANEAIVRRQFEHAEALGIGSSDLSKFEMIEMKI